MWFCEVVLCYSPKPFSPFAQSATVECIFVCFIILLLFFLKLVLKRMLPLWGLASGDWHLSPGTLNINHCVSRRAHPRSGSVQTSPTSTPMSGRRGRQLPQVPSKGTLDRSKSLNVSWEDHLGLCTHVAVWRNNWLNTPSGFEFFKYQHSCSIKR